MLVCPQWEGWYHYRSQRALPFPAYVHVDVAETIEEYEALPDKFSYDCIIVHFGG